MRNSMNSVVSIEKCESYKIESVQNAINDCIKSLGGIKSFIKKGDQVLIKPNMLQAKSPKEAVTTHPQVIEAVINIVQDLGATPLVGDSPGGPEEGLKSYWEKTGYSDVCNRLNVELVNFEKSGIYVKERNNRKYYIAKPVLDCDFIINLPKIKTHSLTMFTGAVKNMYGVIPGLRKTEYHRLAPKPSDFAEIVADVYALATPHLNIADGIVGMEGAGPSGGNPRALGLVLASEDGLALDSLICHILGKKPLKIPLNRLAYEQGLGEADINNIQVLGEVIQIKDFKWPPNLANSLNMIPSTIAQGLMKFYWSRPAINPERCSECDKCVKSCPVDALKEGVYIPDYDYSLCINCLCCMEMCPEKAIYLEKSRILRLTSLLSKST